MIGKTLGHYQITEKLGEGGMGVVYKARDTHLDRFVAIKVLPAEKVADSERKRRFVQEAKAASALNHPNIIHIYDIDHSEGADYIAMEYVAGKTLDQRIGHRGLRLNEALKYAVEIADALAKAHSAGIVHRDLKPTNIMVNEDGAAKVLDFGLAKLTEQTQGDESALTADIDAGGKPITDEGVIIGTVSYMSPEQAEGRKVDARSDIFSLGSVLYEMVTGQKAFQGTSKISTLSAILHQEPKPLSGIAQAIPADLEKLINRCLRKDTGRRYQHMDDVKIALLELKEDSDSGKLVGEVPVQRKGGSYLWLSMILVLAGCLALAAWLWQRRTGPVTPQTPMTAVPLITYPGVIGLATFSPDGNEIAFEWNGERQDNIDIYRKLIGPGEPLRLTTNPAGDFCPAWSPDGKFIAFLRQMQEVDQYGILIIPALGGPERRLAQIDVPPTIYSKLAWSPDNKYLIATDRDDAEQSHAHGLHVISVETGEKIMLTSPPVSSIVSGDGSACFSPGGHSLAFVRLLDVGVGDIYRISLDGNYRAKGDPERLTYEGRGIASPVWTQEGSQILYSSGKVGGAGRVVRRIALSGPKGSAGYPTAQESFGEDADFLDVSRAGFRLVYRRLHWDANIYRIELRDKDGRVGAPQKFIASTQVDREPVYSPDGRTIAFQSVRSGSQEVWACNADGSNPRQLTSIGGAWSGDPSWSPDGKTLVFDSVKGGSADLYLINGEGGAPRRLTSDPQIETDPSWSRDGTGVYFWSDRTGRGEVYKMPAGGGKAIQVTRNGGAYASESLDGKWLYYSKATVEGTIAIWKVLRAGGEESLFHEGPVSATYNFVVVDDGIYFTNSGGTLDFIDFKSGKNRTVCKVDKGWSWGLSISPDHRWILCSLLEEGFNDLMLVENFR
jgi:Tol biopolymer transport system component/tRNA A-37 threonylcarbamoyl transferase component Bud32